VEALHRDRIGGLALPDDLAPGEWRLMSAQDIAAIFSA
jgi:16S rRNA pseudouridine516 synthase